MDLLKQLIIIDKSSVVPVYLQIANAMILSIRQGRMRPGLKLPGSRKLAATLKIHRKTMLAALEELLAQGWIEIIPRKGTFVAKDLPEIKPRKIKGNDVIRGYSMQAGFTFRHDELITFPSPGFNSSALVINDGFPDIRLAPTDLFFRELRRLGKQRAFRKYFHYGNPKGPDHLIEVLTSFLERHTRTSHYHK